MAISLLPIIFAAPLQPKRDTQNETNDKTAGVRPIGHATARWIRDDAVHDLHAHPKSQHDPRRHREDFENDNEDDQNIDLRPRE